MRPEMPQRTLRLFEALTFAVQHDSRYDVCAVQKHRTTVSANQVPAITYFTRCHLCCDDTWHTDHGVLDMSQIFKCAICCLSWHPICSYLMLQRHGGQIKPCVQYNPGIFMRLPFQVAEAFNQLLDPVVNILFVTLLHSSTFCALLCPMSNTTFE